MIPNGPAYDSYCCFFPMMLLALIMPLSDIPPTLEGSFYPREEGGILP